MSSLPVRTLLPALLLVMCMMVMTCGTAFGADAAAADATAQAAAPAKAEASEKPAKKPDTPAVQKKNPGVPVRVVHSGTDALGARLALALKEIFAASPLFVPTGKDAPQLRILLTTREEFGGRPGLGSVFSVTWVYSENEGTLKYHLSSEVGFVDVQSLADTAKTLAARTADRAEQYAYLLP